MSSLNLMAFRAMPWDLDRVDCAISLLGKQPVTRNLGSLLDLQTGQQIRKPSHINRCIFNSLRHPLRRASPPYGRQFIAIIQ